MVPVSAHKKIGLDDLSENILVLAEVQDLQANPNRPAQGVVIEAKLDKGRGPVASVLIQKGTLRVGDTIIVGTCFGKVRAMNNERGERVKKPATSSTSPTKRRPVPLPKNAWKRNVRPNSTSMPKSPWMTCSTRSSRAN